MPIVGDKSRASSQPSTPVGGSRMRGRVRIAVGLATLAAIVPASVAVAGQSAQQPHAVGASTIGAPSVDPAGVLRGGPIRGMIAAGFGKSAAPTTTDLPRLKALGVNTVSAYIYTYMPSTTANVVNITSKTMTDPQLSNLVTVAHQLGMAVEFAPVIVVDGSYFWRGAIQPSNV